MWPDKSVPAGGYLAQVATLKEHQIERTPQKQISSAEKMVCLITTNPNADKQSGQAQTIRGLSD